MEIIASTAPDSINFLRISNSEPPASLAEFAMTKPAPALAIQGTEERLNPNVIPVVSAWHAERKTRAVVFEALFVDAIDVEWRISHHKIKLADGIVNVFVI